MEAILQTLIGGILALSGAFVAQYFQRKHERWVANRENERMLRDKAEELFEDLDRFFRESREATLSVVKKIIDDGVETKGVPDLGRVRAIAAIYFPTTLSLIGEFELAQINMSKFAIEQAKKAMETSDGGAAILKALPMVLTVKHQESATNFVNQMRDKLCSSVPILEMKN